MSILQKIVRQLVGDLTDEFKHVLERYVDGILRRFLRVLVIGGIGITFVAVGFIFILISTVAYLSQFMYHGLAWGIVGLIAVLVGGALLLLIRR